MNLTDLDTFVRVAEHGSFTGAADELRVPKSTVSRRVARLEDQLCVQLLQRAARSISLTEHGRQLFERCSPALREIARAGASLLDLASSPRGRLSVTAPPDIGGTTFFANLVSGFRHRFPDVVIHVELTPRMVDLIEEGVDVALRVHGRPLPESTSVMVRRLRTFPAGLYASPGYLERHGRPQEPAELSNHTCVTHTASGLANQWRLEHRGGEPAQIVEVNQAVAANDFALMLSTIVNGVGIGVAPAFLAEPHLLRGELECVMPDWCIASGYLSLSWPRARYLAPRVRAFIDHVIQHEALANVFYQPAAPPRPASPSRAPPSLEPPLSEPPLPPAPPSGGQANAS